MGERVGTDPGYCETAEELMQFTLFQNMAAARLEKPLTIRGLPKPDPELAYTRAKVQRSAAQAAKVLLDQCARCELSAIRSDALGESCPIIDRSKELQQETEAQISNLRASHKDK